MASIDATVVGIALPAIGRDFGASLTVLQWVVTAYTLTLAGLLLFAGTLGRPVRPEADLPGRRRMVRAGLGPVRTRPGRGGPDRGPCRAGSRRRVADAGQPGHIEATFRPADRGKAIGAWSGLSGVATAIGKFLGGWLVQAVSWRLIFVINLPVAGMIVAVSVRHLPESRDRGMTGRVDITGGILATPGWPGGHVTRQ
jgi:MFS family permease